LTELKKKEKKGKEDKERKKIMNDRTLLVGL
jgi:hypothetical protein